jgi:hypothetical protein
MPRVFISFRKIDERWMRDRIYQALTSRFAASQFFKSGESITPGSDFAPILIEQARSCEVMLILIGSRWVEAGDETGRRLIDRKGDWVRREIATSISAGNRVVPVLLGDTTRLPEPSQLPPDIAHIGRLQFLRVQETHLDAALDDFVASVARLLPDLRAATAPASERSGSPVRAETQSGSAEGPAGQPERSALDTMRHDLSHDDAVKRIKAARWVSQDRYPEAVHDVDSAGSEEGQSEAMDPAGQGCSRAAEEGPRESVTQYFGVVIAPNGNFGNINR